MSKQVKRPKKSLINFRGSDADRSVFEKKAKKHSRGNVSEWLRTAGINYSPRTKESRTGS